MGLAIQVGGFDDEEDLEMFEPLSQALVAEGLAPHVEPRDLGPDGAFSCGMHGYSGLHHLRRLAAYLGQNLPVPGPGTSESASDPVLRDYYDLLAPGFEHLLLHSDAEGFYVPVKFEEVIFPDEDLEVPGAMIGSAAKLLEECTRLAQWLELPLEIDPESGEVWDAVANPSATDGPKWRRFGVESFICIRLIRACEASLRTGAAIVFC